MFNRICKYRKESSEVTAFRQCFLLCTFSLFHSLIMPFCYNCVIRGISSCRVFESNSGCCKVCVLANCTGCNVLGVTEKQLMNFAVQYICLENEVQRATEKLLRL